MDRLRAFEVFTTVVARGGFARAAETLDTSPANVTRYIAELETYLGTRLLNRSSRRISMTEAGAALDERLRQVLVEVAEAEAAASASAVTARGRLRINAPLSFGVIHLAPIWPLFTAEHPGVELDITLSDRVVDMVEEGFDLVVRISRAGSQTHVARKLASSRSLLCAAPAYLAKRGSPTAPADLADHDCLAYSFSQTPGEWPLFETNGAEHRARFRPAALANNGETLRELAIAGAGIASLPTFIAGDALRAGTLVPVLPVLRPPEIDILAVYPSRRHLSAKVRLMVDFLAGAFHGTPSWDVAFI
ncbi:LysR family transcriptional regulator [Sphingomonas sp. PAMC 26605]|uniref:LysR family transcriptional regulator n=1 Tax=Sphingomonas sp. PAMC 26605 TaxID=1112214 RepID=UPI00026CAD1C|nr:LysR family transcriptional regulator [Sphingomonas sp. PAMC 26605]